MRITKRKALLILALIVAWSLIIKAVLGFFQVRKEKLDEAVVVDGPVFKIKVVRYYEHYPLHFSGVVNSLQCQARDTAGFPPAYQQDEGWHRIGGVVPGPAGADSAAALVEPARAAFEIIGDRVLLLKGGVSFRIAFDGCREIHDWNPLHDLEPDAITSTEKPEWCKPKGTADCRHFDLSGDRAPVYSDVQVSPDRKISFVARSKGFRDPRPIRVSSSDGGRTWTVTRQ